MTKKDLKRILTLHDKGLDRKMCIQAIIETAKSPYDAAQAIDEFMNTLFEESWQLKKKSFIEREFCIDCIHSYEEVEV